jgi:hypothetical protein
LATALAMVLFPQEEYPSMAIFIFFLTGVENTTGIANPLYFQERNFNYNPKP